jgi:hypothetical protein
MQMAEEKRLQISRRQQHANATRDVQLNRNQKGLHPPSPILLTTRTRTRTVPIHSPIIPTIRIFPARNKLLPSSFCLILDVLAQNLVAPPRHKRNKHDADQQRKTQQQDIDWHRVLLEQLVRCGVERRLREVEDASEADDEAVDFAKGGEAEDLCGVVAARVLAYG